MTLRGRRSALTCTPFSYKCIMFRYFKHKILNTDIWNYFKMKRYFKCKMKTTSRWQKVTGNKWVIATVPNHLTHRSQTQFLEGHSSAQFSSNPNQTHLIQLIKVFRIRNFQAGVIWSWLELNCAELWPSRNWVWDHWFNGWFIQKRNAVMLLRDAKNSAVAVWNIFFVGEMERKQVICV